MYSCFCAIYARHMVVRDYNRPWRTLRGILHSALRDAGDGMSAPERAGSLPKEQPGVRLLPHAVAFIVWLRSDLYFFRYFMMFLVLISYSGVLGTSNHCSTHGQFGLTIFPRLPAAICTCFVVANIFGAYRNSYSRYSDGHH